jgi:methyl-accepting chemotaxis protein
VQKLRQLSIRQKIIGLSAFLLTALALTSVVAISSTGYLGRSTQDTTDHDVQAALLITNADRDIYQAQIALEGLPTAVYMGDAGGVKDLVDAYQENAGQVQQRYDKFKDAASAEFDNQSDWAKFESDYTAWKADAGKVVSSAAVSNGDNASAAAAAGAALKTEQESFSTTREHLNSYEEFFSQDRISGESDELERKAQRTELLVIIIAIVSFGLGLPISFWVSKSVMGVIGDNARRLSGSSSTLAALSAQLGSNSKVTVEEAMTVSTASEIVADNVNTVASAIEQMEASIREISSNAGEANRIASEGVSIAATTNDQVGRLGESGAEIGKVLDVITSIAEQTNLLALNATIEAARAGEAGKGFAVVANEVKELAKETSNATEVIAQRIATIQADTADAAGSIAGITAIIDQINGIQASIAGAVEEQTATTSEIARSIGEASSGVNDINERIRNVAHQAQESSQGAQRTEEAAGELMSIANTLGSDKRSDESRRPQNPRERFMGGHGVDTPSTYHEV